MTINLYNCGSDPRVINKNLSLIYTADATPYGEVSIMAPVLRLRQSVNDLAGINYVYIADWLRYYFVDDIRFLSGGIIEIHCKIDVLMTYASAILNSVGICIANENKGRIIEYDDGTRVKTSSTMIQDPNQPVYPYVIQSVYEFDDDIFNTDRATSLSRNFVLNVSGGEGE